MAALLALLVLAPEAPAQGAPPTLTVDPASGPSGATIAAEGAGFVGSCGVRLLLEDPDGNPVATLGEAAAGRDGGFATEVVVPAVAPGSYAIVARGLRPGRTGLCDLLTVDAPSAGQPFTVEAPPPPPPTTTLTVSNPSPPPGGVVLLTASNPSPSIAFYQFDLNGNGSFETKCDGPGAAVVSGGKAKVEVAVQAVSESGAKSGATQLLTFSGKAVVPPNPGGGKLSPYAGGTIAGGCAAGGIAEATIKAYQCPTTVSVGVAEASIPPGPGEHCFERKKQGTAFAQFVNTGKKALVNGMQLETISSKLVIGEKLKLLTTTAPYGKKDTKLKASRPGYSTVVASAPFYLYWDIAKAGQVGTVPLASPFGFGRFLGLPYAAKSSPLKLTGAGKAEFKVYLELPLPKVLFKSIATSQPVTVKTDADEGVEIAGGGYQIKVNDVNAGVFRLEDIVVSYQRQGSSDVWSGGFDLAFPQSGVSANGSVIVRDGVLEKLAAAVNPGPPGIGPIGCCVWVVGFDGTLTNEYIDVGATFAAGPQVVNNARAADAHGHATVYYEPFEFLMTVDDAHVVTVPVKVKGQVSVSAAGLWFSANVNQGFGPFSLDADVKANVGKKSWSAVGSGDGCISVVIDACVGVSAGAGPVGVAGCGGITIIPGTWFNDPVKLSGGAVVYWPLGSGYDTFTGCGMSKIESKVGASAALDGPPRRAAGLAVPGGTPVALFAVEGEGAHPVVRLRGPKGIDISSPAGPGLRESGPGYFATTLTADDTTYIAVGRPPKGRYTVSTLPGSAPIASVGLGEGLPKRMARGVVRGRGRTRTLRYRVARVRGAKVTFVERGGKADPKRPGQTVDRVLGTTRGGTGRLRFTPAEAKFRKRRIEAIVETAGTGYRTERVASFRAPRFRRLPGPRVRTIRRGNRLVVGWSKVGGAGGYKAAVDIGAGETLNLTRGPGKRKVMIRGLDALSDARVEVRALSSDGWLGRPGRARLGDPAPVRAPRRLSASRLLRRGGLAIRCTAYGQGRCEGTLRKGRQRVAKGSRSLPYAATKVVRLKLTKAGRRVLRRSPPRSLRLLVDAPGSGPVARRLRLRG